MSKKKTVFNAYDLLNSPEMSAYLDQVEAEEAERQKRRDAEMAARQRQSGSKPGRSVSDDELSADALKRDNIRQTTDDISGRANDVWQALKSGGAQLIQGAGWLANEAGAHDSGQFLRDIGQIGEDQALANMTPAGREAQKNGVFKEDLSGVNDDWGRGMAQGIAGSAVPSIVGAVLGAPVARGIGAAGDALLGRAAVSEGALGSVLDAAIKYTPAPVMRLAGALPGAVGAGAGEAAVTGATNGAQAYQEVMDAPIKSLRKSPAFQSLSKELGSEDAARKAIADRMSIQIAKDTALSTGLIGAAMGGGAVGSLLNKFAVKQGAKEVGRLGAKAAAKEVLKDGAKEFTEEFAQSGPEHYLQNAAKRDYLDPTIDPSTGMLRASLEGGVVGMGQGMGMSGGAHAVNRLLARNEPQPSQPANTPQQQPNTQPSSTPEPVAGYDPIAPNQQALLQRLGVEPDPAADEAAASVASIFGAGDPTAGLVASVMRGEALQPIHDMAAVRANTVLPVGSNEGGLYEPQWLPDAAQGESANGMRMPRRGFDSQEQLLANAGMDAQDMQRRADIASQVDAAWAQQQNPVQKARELESLAQESAVQVAIDRAEQSNQINQALANAAGEGMAVPNAMQLALQQAESRRNSAQNLPDSVMTKALTTELKPNSDAGSVDVQRKTTELPTELPTELKSNSVDAQRTHGDDKSREIATNHASVESKAPNTSDQAPNISSEPALTMQQNERGQWIIKGDMAQHAQTIRDALPGTKLVVSQKSGQALVQMPADKNTGKQGKAIRKALDHLLLSGEQLAARDQQRANASERAKAANKQAQQIDHERDDIVNAVAKLGGIDTEQALSEWWRGQRETIGHYNAEVPGNLRRQGVFAFKRGGMAIDDMVRHLEGEGYLPHNATPNDLLDALENRSKHPAGYEADARREFDARQQEEQTNAPGEFQQAYDEGRFADEFTKRELEEETDYFELNRQNREAAEDAAATAKAAELDALIDNAPVIPSRPGPVTEEELDAIFGQQSRNAAAEGTQTDREPAAGRSMEGAESGTATAEAAPEEDGFGLASYTESDLRREEQAAEQQQREVERQRAAADKARQDEETRKEIRRRSEAAADTFTLGGNAEDNLTGQGGLFDAPAETIHKPISKSDGSGFATRDALRAAATRDGIPQSSLIEKRDEAGNWIGLRHEPDGAIDRIITDQSRAGKVIGTSVRDLHSDDVYTLLMAASSKKQINAIADYIGKYAPRAAADAVKSHLDSALKQKGWATEESLYGGGMFDAPTESSSAQNTSDSPENTAETPQNAASDAETAAPVDENVTDFGEKIGGARKDTASKIGPRTGTKTEDNTPTWAKRYAVVKSAMVTEGRTQRMRTAADGEEWHIFDKRTNKAIRDGWKQKVFASEAEAEAALPLIALARNHRVTMEAHGEGNPVTYKIVRDVTERKRVTLKDGFTSRDDAMRYMAEHAVDLLEQKTSFGEEILEKPERAMRLGVERRTGPATTEMFRDTFGFRGVEFGNWNNQDERREVMNHAYDGLLDLADVLNVPPMALSLNGELALGFGSRGHGLSGARAHYEGDYVAINLTKMSGAGSMAHEWFHAFDHYMGRMGGVASNEWKTKTNGDRVLGYRDADELASNQRTRLGKGIREELREALDNVYHTLQYKAEQYIEDTEKAEKWVDDARARISQRLQDVRNFLTDELTYKSRHNKPATPEQLAEFDRLAERLINGEDMELAARSNPSTGRLSLNYSLSNDTLDAISAIYKKVRGASGFNKAQNGQLDRVANEVSYYRQRKKTMDDARNTTPKQRNIPTEFKRNSHDIDQGRVGDYWSTPHEMAARAFSAYIEDRIGDAGGASQFLSFGSDNNRPGYTMRGIRPFPEGQERIAINSAFNALFQTIRTRETEVDTGSGARKGMALYSKANAHTNTQGMPAKDLQAIIAKALPAHLRERVKVAQSRSNTAQQSARPEDNDLIEAEYDPATGQLTLYADAIPTPERALFVLSHELTHYGLDAKYGFGLSSILLEARNNPMIAKLAAAIAVDRGMTVNSVRQDIADARGVPVARVARSAAVHRLQVETANEALAELNAAIERNDFAYLQDRYGVAVPKMMRNDLRGRLSRLAASVKAWLAKLTGKQATDYSDKQVWDLLAGVRETVRGGGKLSAGYSNGAAQHSMAASSKTINVDGVTRPTTNSNGQPIAQTEEGLRNFWRWFGDSKVVDKDGKPLVVYHGTESDFDSFDQNKVKTTKLGSGFYFAKDPETANLYAGFSGSNVVPVYLRMERPLIASSVEEARQILEDNGQYMNIDEFRGTHAADMAAVLAKAGFDGIMYDGVMVVQNPTQIKSAIGNRGTFSSSDPNILRSTAPKQPASAGFVLPEETTTQQAQREVQDNMNRWKQVLENVREQGGQVDEQNDVYSAEERFHGRAATRIEDFARDEVEPLMERLADSGHTLQEVEQYLLAQHAEEANARIREIDDSRDTAFGMEDGEAQSILAKFAAMPDAAEFKRLANDFRRISEGTLSLYVKAGIVSPEAAHAMRQAYQFYVPVKGGDEDQAARQGTGKGLSVNGKQKRRMGHDMRDEHVLENMLRDRQRAIVLAEKNNVGTYLLDLIERNPDPKLWTVNVLPKQKVLRDQVSYVVELNGQMLDAFNSLEAARVFIQAEAARTGSKPGAFAVSKSSDPYVTMMAKPTLQDHEVQVYVQGRAVRIQLHDPILAGQYRRMGTEQMGRIIEAGKSLNRWLSKVYTGYNPEFFIKNVVRDLFAGSINLTADQGGKVAAKALSHWPKAGAAMFRFALTGKAPAGEYGKALQRYRAAGGSTGAAYMGDLERQADTLQTLYENYSGAMAAMQEGKPVKAAKIATRKLLGGLAHWFEVWNQAGENAFRLATFMAMEDAGKTVAQSASMAKNVTVNFNRKGELTPQLGALYLFFNPNVQGTARMYQSLFGKDAKHKAQAWAMVGAMAGARLALAAMGRALMGDDEWEEIPDGVKDRNLIIALGNGRKLTIPLPYGYSFFASMANRLDAVMHGESAEKASVRLASAVFENFSPVGNPVGDDPKLENTLLLLPTALKIPALPAANLSGFGGQMRPEYDRSQPDNEKMYRGTRGSLYDKAAQAISGGAESIGIGSRYENDWADISPETIKYLVKTLTGGTGGFLADSASLLNVLASGSTPDVSEVPFVRSGMRESTVKDARARFHELGNEAKEHVAAWKRAVDAGDDKAATEYEQDGELMAMGEMLEGYRKQATALRDLMAMEMQREDLTLAEKRMKQKAYENQEAEVYRDFIRQFKH